MNEYIIMDEIIDYLAPRVGGSDEGVSWMLHLRNLEKQTKELKVSKRDYDVMYKLQQAGEKELEKANQAVEAAKDVIHNNTGSGWSNAHLDRALEKLQESLLQLKDKP